MSPEVYILLLAILVQAITTIDGRIPSLVRMGQEKKPEAICGLQSHMKIVVSQVVIQLVK